MGRTDPGFIRVAADNHFRRTSAFRRRIAPLVFLRLCIGLNQLGKVTAILIADNDLWIAACAIRHSIPLVSNNFKHFDGIPGLILRSEAQAMKEIKSQMHIEEGVTPSSTEQQQLSSQSSSADEPTAPPPAQPLP